MHQCVIFVVAQHAVGQQQGAIKAGLQPVMPGVPCPVQAADAGLALLDAKGFGAEDFARSHPGGALGRRLLIRLRDVMRTGAAIPTVAPEASVAEAIREITRGGIGMTLVISPERRVLGIFTDGDLRRALLKQLDLSGLSVRDVMTPSPRTIGPEKLAAEAVEMMERLRINQIPVVEDSGQLIGALNMHDLFQAKAI